MRVRIVFELKNKGAMVPFHHQPLTSNFIKSIILQLGKTDIRSSECFTFSALKGQTRTSKKGLHFFSSKVTLVFSSHNEPFTRQILDYIFSQSQIQIGELTLQPESVEKELFIKPADNTKFLCISPLALTNPEIDDTHNKSFIFPDEDEFSDLVYEETLNRMEKSGLYSPEQLNSFFKFQIVPDTTYLSKVKENEKKFARIYTLIHGKQKYELRGYTFPFTLYADPMVQEFVINCGLGAYTHEGYGMVDLVEDWMTKRVAIPEYSQSGKIVDFD